MRGYNLILRKLIVNNGIIYCDKLSSINWWKWYGIILMNNAICDDGDDDECMNKTFESWKYAAYIQKFRLQHTPTEVLRRILRFYSRLCITVSVNGPFNKCCYPFQDQLVSKNTYRFISVVVASFFFFFFRMSFLFVVLKNICFVSYVFRFGSFPCDYSDLY